MRFAIDFTPHRWSTVDDAFETTQRVVDRAVAAEAAGFDAVWVSEDPDAWDAAAMLAAIGARTTRIGLTTGVVNPFYRHPAQIASMIATLDRLSGGRFRLGIGRGQPEWYGRALGIDVDQPLARLRQTISLLRQWEQPGWSASADGPLVINDWVRSFGPLSAHVPVLIAAAGPRAIALAGELADGVIFNDLTAVPVMAATIAAARAAATAAGRDPSALKFIARPVITVTSDPEPLLQRMKERLAIVNTLPGMDRLIRVPGFDVDAIMAEVRRVMRTDEVLAGGGGFPELRAAADYPAVHRIIPTELVDELAMIGPVARIAEKLQYLAQLGIDEVVLRRADLPVAGEWATFLQQWRRNG